MQTDYLIWAVKNKEDLSPQERINIITQLERKPMKDHVNHLKYEIEVLKSRVQEHDTGHIITAIQVLESRIKELSKQTEEVLDSTYPDGDGYWK
jgi:3-phenylpropionate/cinnamic acid dioxygenase small subunit